MEDKDKPAEQLINELAEIRKQISELKSLEEERKQTEEFLTEDDISYRILAENIKDMLIMWDMKLHPLYTNPSVKILLGYSIEEAANLSSNLERFMTPDSFKVVSKVIEERLYGKDLGPLAPERQAPIELELVRKDGSTVWTETKTSFLRNRDRQRIGFISVTRDITERKDAQEAMEASEERYRRLVETITDSVFTLDLDGRFTYLNPGSEKISGYPVEDLIGHHFTDILAPEYVESTLERFSQGISGQETPIYEAELIHKDGGRVYIEMNVGTLFNADGRPAGRIGIARDITGRKRMLDELKESEALKTSILDAIPHAIIGLEQRRIVFANDGVRSVFGWEPEELIGKDTKVLYRNDAEYEEIGRHFYPVLERQRTYSEEFPCRHKDGGDIVCMVSTSRISEKLEGKRIVATYTDITEYKNMEEERQKAQKLQSIAVLAGGIAHDFNNILTAIIGNISLAKVYANPEDKIFNLLSAAEKASFMAKDLTRQLLTFARGGAPIREVSSIEGLIKDSASFVLKGSNSRCEFLIPDDLWMVEADKGQLSQVINNLIINAAQAMPEGGVIKVSAENTTTGGEHGLSMKKGRYVKISIEDQGIGIPEEHLQKIFDPYFTTKQKGSGLGLTISYSIIKTHDGYIIVESEMGVGSTFYIYLPASNKEIAKEMDAEEGPTFGRGKILIMDDEEMVRDIALEMLKSLGYEAKSAQDGVEAIELYKHAKESGSPFDVVIMDLTIPGSMGGKKAIKKLLEIDPKAKAIVSSGYSNDPIMANSRRYGFTGVVAKPYKIQELSEVLHKVIMDINE